MIKILFVCHGNICRSPMAEFIMKDLVEKSGLSDEFVIASAAVSSEETGNPVYPPAKKKLAEHGLSCEGKTARKMTWKDCQYYDLIVCMDARNIKRAEDLVGKSHRHQMSLLLDYTDRAGEDISDPWYTGDFDAAWDDILLGCEGLLEYIMQFYAAQSPEELAGGRYFRVISDLVRFGCGYRTEEGRTQYFAFHGSPNHDSDYFVTAEISMEEYVRIGTEYPKKISADRDAAELFRKKYVEGHPVIMEGWDVLP
ncbi:MAG: low molecular weight phosphotyrosine protein phosphatase [Firmicutes bacterium]|nr:low molecular weight phosphotyrosine protein phosphatase [Bacillota bacterium]